MHHNTRDSLSSLFSLRGNRTGSYVSPILYRFLIKGRQSATCAVRNALIVEHRVWDRLREMGDVVVVHTESPLELFNLPLTESLVLDVQTLEKYAEAHVSGACNFPLSSTSTESDIEAALLVITDPETSRLDPKNLLKVCVYGPDSSALKVAVDFIAAQGIPVR